MIVTQILELVSNLAKESNIVLLVEQNAVTLLRVATTGWCST